MILQDSHILGLWLVFAGVCLRGFEDVVYRKEQNFAFDTIDSLIVSQVHTRTVEQFEESPKSTKQPAQTVIPTGFAADIAQLIKHRKAK
jgi:hypothetical protein